MLPAQSTDEFVPLGRSVLRIFSLPLTHVMNRTLVAACLLMTALLWSNSRILAMRSNQNPDKPVVLSGYYVYHGMAAALEDGRLGQLDLNRYRHYVALGNPNAVYKRFSDQGSPEFVDYYTLDIGYSFIVEIARLAFPTLPDNHWRSIALQLLVDVGLVVLVYTIFASWDIRLGALAALFYTGNKVFLYLASFAYYYYWDVVLTLTVFALLLLTLRRAGPPAFLLGLTGFVLGFGVWMRASWWPITCFLLALMVLTPALRKQSIWCALIFGLVAAPQIYRSSRARGSLVLSTRASWHVALVGLGYYPNPYGLEANDEAVYRLTREKYGVPFRMDDYKEHDQAVKKEFLSLLRKDPQFVLRSFRGRLWESLLGTTVTSMAPYPFLPNPVYRLVCLTGLVLMVLAGGERRWLGVAAAGTYLVYVLVTCLFYFVGLAYDNVSQVALLVLFLGGLGSAPGAASRLARRWRAARQGSDVPPAPAPASG
ncbi:MAG TPA: hypothetical protein VN461_22770 [Vicinamibacteria bacterium]|nr:hypothetical protein [Vicinamibacteria bacterium]